MVDYERGVLTNTKLPSIKLMPNNCCYSKKYYYFMISEQYFALSEEILIFLFGLTGPCDPFQQMKYVISFTFERRR